MRPYLVGLLLGAFATSANAAQPWCGAQAPEPSIVRKFSNAIAAVDRKVLQQVLAPIPISLHIITDGKKGKLTQGQVDTMINNINWAYRDTSFQFYISSIDVTKNKSWFSNCNSNSKNQTAMKKRLARDTRHYVNIYSCNPYDPSTPPGLIVLGKATFPFQYPDGSYLHGILLHPNSFPGGSPDMPYGLTAAHEIGHYLGLFHTFEKLFNPSGDGCDAPGDYVADTPTQAGPHYSCPDSIDTCPALPGLDDVPNFMNYSTDSCMEHFSPGQIDLMILATATYRPNLGH